ncbi:uncharacterized protein EAF01_003429 [Botrytis porri]|uniref:Uncharacterized protein n=1 Tax=Botrytis porri TaxID=87229 RepID=A0A4Z1K7T1_9HELO|nr:uncharacterized protein EAF01_003429 [Botrytis porri]KAF7909711.1 hypothetical protein EAF01_003429 [Botrytis porri]TGO82037.1 hypothetical protein BPOR_0939g00030 [Botrytis porri]
MSNSTEILIEKLELKLILRERVFIKWEDESGTPRTLGSRLRCNGQNLNFFIAIYYDKEGHLHIHFSLEVSIMLGSNKQKTEILLVVQLPPHTNFSDTTKPRLISSIGNLSHLDASAIHDAEISDSMHVIGLQFDLIAKGFIITKRKNTRTIKPRNHISKELIYGFESLSDTKTFTVYIKPNDYALVGLEEVRNRLSNTPINIHKTNMKEIYIEQTPELVEWSRLGPISLLPPDTKNPHLLTEVQAPRSLSTFEQETSSVNIIGATTVETLPQILPRHNSTMVHANVSHDCEELLDIPVNLDDVENDPRYIEINFDVDSDEEQLAKAQLANLDSWGSNQQFDYNSKISQALNLRLLKWIQTTMRINSNVYEHKHLTTKLSILGNCVRKSDTSLFNATLFWCSAMFFYDPLDSDPDNTLGLWKETNSWFISDIANLIRWANGIHHDIEINVVLLKHFIRLGDVARVTALDSRCNKDKYYDQKGVCTTCVLTEFNNLGNSNSKENNKSVCRKRKGLGAHSTAASKLIKM